MPAGRPTKKTEFSLAKILELTKEGKSSQEIADLMDLSRATIDRWIESDIEFCYTVKKLRSEADEMIEKSLYNRAHGFSKTIKTQKVGKDGQVVDVEETQYFPPDSQALKFWLMNRQRDKYTDRTQHEITGADGKAFEVIVKDYRGTKE